ncbi:MAG: DegV family protein [Oscillospiraceae bacterium]
MNDYVLFTDVTTDLTVEILKDIDVISINMPFFLDENQIEHYPDYKNISVSDFYQSLREKTKITTSQINSRTYVEYFEKALSKGKDILYLGFSSGLSGTMQSATIAIEMLKEKYTDRKIYAVDTLCASSGEGMFVYYAALKKKNGMDIEQLRQWCENSKLNLCHWFTVEDLFFLHRGGRVSKTVAIAGSMLKIMPVMHMDNEGHLMLVDKVRGRHNALEALAEKMIETAVDLPSQTIFISHGDDIACAKYLENYIKSRTAVAKIIIQPVNPIIGAHSGPGTIALFFWGTER